MEKKMSLASGFCLFLSIALFPWNGAAAEKAGDKFSISGTGQYFFIEQFISEPEIVKYDRMPGKGGSPDDQIAKIGTEAEALPVSYTNRKFITGGSAFTYDIYTLPGSIVRYDPSNNNYEFVNLTRFVKNGAYPKSELIEHGILYDQRINSGASFNGSALIAKLSIAKDHLAEIVIQDIMKSTIPDELILTDVIKAKVQELPAAKLHNYYFIRSCVLTIINYRVFEKSSFKIGIACSYITADSKVYKETGHMKRDRIVSIDLVSLEDIL